MANIDTFFPKHVSSSQLLIARVQRSFYSNNNKCIFDRSAINQFHNEAKEEEELRKKSFGERKIGGGAASESSANGQQSIHFQKFRTRVTITTRNNFYSNEPTISDAFLLLRLQTKLLFD